MLNKKIKVVHKSKKYVFKRLTRKDTSWLEHTFADPDRPELSGLSIFKERISDFENYSLLAQTLTIVMHYLLRFPENLSLDEFEKSFGVKYRDIALLYLQLNLCVGNRRSNIYLRLASRLLQLTQKKEI